MRQERQTAKRPALLALGLLLTIGLVGCGPSNEEHAANQLKILADAHMVYGSDNDAMFPNHIADAIEYINADPELVFRVPPDALTAPPTTVPNPLPTEPYTYGSFTFIPLGGLSWDHFEDFDTFLFAYYQDDPSDPDDTVVCYLSGRTEVLDEDDFKALRDDALDQIEAMRAPATP